MPIRLRLALWSGAILAVGLLGFSTLIYLLAGQALRSAADSVISGRAHRVDALLLTSPSAGLSATAEQARLTRIAQVFSSPGVAVLLLDAHGTVIGRSQGMILPAPPCPAPCERPAAGPYGVVSRLPDTAFYDQRAAGEPFRVFVLRRASTGFVRYILVGHSVQDIANTLQTLLTLLISGSVLCLLLVTAAAWSLARRALGPIAAITRTAARIAESGDFADRVQAPARQDEVGQLAATFNAMLNRLAEFHTAQRRFVSDASHELRAPLTTIRGNAELLLLDSQAPAEEREDAVRDIAAEAARLTRLVDGLLALARGDAGQRLSPQPVRLHEVLASACQVEAERARGPRVVLGRCDPAVVCADPDRLDQLLIILLDNAAKYTPADGNVTCSLQAQGGWATVMVSDTGIGIHPDDLPHIFERFYRADRARSREEQPALREEGSARSFGTIPGTGLGLAIARQIVEEAAGSIAVRSTPGQGATFTVRLPLHEARADASRPCQPPYAQAVAAEPGDAAP